MVVAFWVIITLVPSDVKNGPEMFFFARCPQLLAMKDFSVVAPTKLMRMLEAVIGDGADAVGQKPADAFKQELRDADDDIKVLCEFLSGIGDARNPCGLCKSSLRPTFLVVVTC